MIDLHRLIELNGDLATFASYGSDEPILAADTVLDLYSWWSPDQLEVATNENLKWELRSYPEDADHVHCRLTWEDHLQTSCLRLRAGLDPRQRLRAVHPRR